MRIRDETTGRENPKRSAGPHPAPFSAALASQGALGTLRHRVRHRTSDRVGLFRGSAGAAVYAEAAQCGGAIVRLRESNCPPTIYRIADPHSAGIGNVRIAEHGHMSAVERSGLNADIT